MTVRDQEAPSATRGLGTAGRVQDALWAGTAPDSGPSPTPRGRPELSVTHNSGVFRTGFQGVKCSCREIRQVRLLEGSGFKVLATLRRMRAALPSSDAGHVQGGRAEGGRAAGHKAHLAFVWIKAAARASNGRPVSPMRLDRESKRQNHPG